MPFDAIVISAELTAADVDLRRGYPVLAAIMFVCALGLVYALCLEIKAYRNLSGGARLSRGSLRRDEEFPVAVSQLKEAKLTLVSDILSWGEKDASWIAYALVATKSTTQRSSRSREQTTR